jgi:RHS repeat-associated protein
VQPGFINAVQPGGSNPPTNVPQAFLTVIFFDERFNFIPAADGGVAQQQVAASVGSNGSSLTLANIKAPKNGYAFIYISNQSNNDVYFDNLQVGITQGNIAEENHYYAYGLKIATLSSKKLGDSYEGTLKNNYLYNDKELFDDADLNWYDYGFRNYDPQIGRFTQLDPLTDDYPFLTPYQYASCDPITNVDVDGLEGWSSIIRGTVTEAAEHGGAIKELGNLVLKSLPRAKLLTTNHSSCHVKPDWSQPSGSFGSGRGGSSRNLYGVVLQAEFGGGNNAPPGETEEDPIEADGLLLLTSSWMSGNPEFAKTWEEIIEKSPERLKELNDMVETYKELKKKKEIEDYLKKAYQEETAPKTIEENTQNAQPNATTGPTKYDLEDPLEYPGPPSKRGYVEHWSASKAQIDNEWKEYRQKHPKSRYVEPAPMRSSQLQKRKTMTYPKKR